MSAHYTIRDFQTDDEAGVVQLLLDTLGEGGSFVRTTDFWRWKHFANPFGTSQLLLAANQQILGLRAFMRWRFRTPAGSLRAVRAVDTSTHPGYRRLGVFSRLTQSSLERARADGVNLIFNTPNPQSMAGYLKLGWRRVGRPRLLARILRPWQFPRAALVGRRRRLEDAGRARMFRTPPQPVEALFAHGEEVERLLARDDALSASGIRTERSVAFLHWRYASAPSLRYHAVWTGGTPGDGLIIFRPNIRRGLREIMVCELLSGDGSPDRGRALVRELLRAVRADYLVAAATPSTPHWRMLRRAGFLPLPERMGPTFVVFPLSWPADQLDPARLDSWRLSLGDLEIF